MDNNGNSQDTKSNAMCPMATMCKGMATKRGAGWMMMLPGLILILVGILIIFEPRILVWLIAGVAILMGVMMLFFANFFRRMSTRFNKPAG